MYLGLHREGERGGGGGRGRGQDAHCPLTRLQAPKVQGREGSGCGPVAEGEPLSLLPGTTHCPPAPCQALGTREKSDPAPACGHSHQAAPGHGAQWVVGLGGEREGRGPRGGQSGCALVSLDAVPCRVWAKAALVTSASPGPGPVEVLRNTCTGDRVSKGAQGLEHTVALPSAGLAAHTYSWRPWGRCGAVTGGGGGGSRGPSTEALVGLQAHKFWARAVQKLGGFRNGGDLGRCLCCLVDFGAHRPGAGATGGLLPDSRGEGSASGWAQRG